MAQQLRTCSARAEDTLVPSMHFGQFTAACHAGFRWFKILGLGAQTHTDAYVMVKNETNMYF